MTSDTPAGRRDGRGGGPASRLFRRRSTPSRARRRVGSVVRMLAALFVAGGVYTALAPGAFAEDTRQLSTAAQEGRTLFDNSCISCHGRDAQGVENKGPSLIGVGSASVEFQVGTGRMPMARQEAQAEKKPPQFDEDQVRQLGQYIQELGGGPQVPGGELKENIEADPDALARGGELFRLNCTSCHGFGGAGGALSSGKYAPALHAATERQIYAAMLSGPQNMPVFGENQLTPEQKRDIITYVSGQLQEDKDPGGLFNLGRYGPVTEGLAIFLVGITILVFASLWIAGEVMTMVSDGTDHAHGGDHPHGADREPVDLSDPRLSRFEIVREGARRDDIEIVHYESQFPHPGTKAEKRIERTIALMFLLAGAAAVAFLVIYIVWDWKFELGHTPSDYFTPLLGITLAVSLFSIGFAILTWAKKLLPHEVSIQDRHEAMSTDEDRLITGQTMMFTVDELGIQRRPLLKGAIAVGLLPVGVVAAAPLIGGLINNPHKAEEPELFTTGFSPALNNGQKVRLTREDGTLRPEDVSVGGQMTVFPGIPGGATNQHADSPTLLIHLRGDDAQEARQNSDRPESMWGNYIAYSKICTHAGCPASLYEQQTNRLLCPCHQSQFLITDNARPIFGPASRRLPMLPIEVDEEGFFVATSDYPETVGPDFWERP